LAPGQSIFSWASIEYPGSASFDCQRCENSRPVGTSINANSIRQRFNFGSDRMTMNDHEAMVGFVE
jgi:hypothetical protein